MNRPNETGPRIIVALDYASAEPALKLAAQLDPARCRLKVGKELFTAAGPTLVSELTDQGFGIFLDLKFHDIPSTVAAACRAAADLGAWMINVHASGGRRMLTAAAESLAQRPMRPLLTGVTVLTSLSQQELGEVGVDRDMADQVLALATLCHDCDLDGVVCSAREARHLRSGLPSGFRLVTPGIRPAGSEADDQTRIMTPAAAVKEGVDYLVIGRPITQAHEPKAALAAIEQEIAAAESAA